ncbi:hypothetical protein PSAC2689_20492 [Paraburkholderia sacchari]
MPRRNRRDRAGVWRVCCKPGTQGYERGGLLREATPDTEGNSAGRRRWTGAPCARRETARQKRAAPDEGAAA